jgi:hypothetical protein
MYCMRYGAVISLRRPMNFQHVLKGISGIADSDANRMLDIGILCNWWRDTGMITPHGVRERLNERNLLWHLSRYNEVDPVTGRPFGELTPFISTSAGTVERDAMRRTNLVHSGLLTAISFATRRYRTEGYVFYGYLYCLGCQSIPLQEFAEETRDVHVYRDFQKYHPQGEIVAKIHIPSVRLEKYEKYDGRIVRADLLAKRLPVPTKVEWNPLYRSPEPYSNIRPAIL